LKLEKDYLELQSKAFAAPGSALAEVKPHTLHPAYETYTITEGSMGQQWRQLFQNLLMFAVFNTMCVAHGWLPLLAAGALAA
jgi:hypothetical protein